MRTELEEELEEARRNVSRLEYLLSSSQIEATQAVEKREAENERQVEGAAEGTHKLRGSGRDSLPHSVQSLLNKREETFADAAIKRSARQRTHPTESITSSESSLLSARPRRIRSRFSTNKNLTPTKFRVICSPTTKKHQACIKKLVTSHDSVLVVCAENNEGDVAAVMAASCSDDRVAISHASVWDIASLVQLQEQTAGGGFTVACLDLTMCGHMLEADGHALLKMLESLFQHTLHTVLVKSKALERQARSFHNSHSFMQSGLPRHHICGEVQVICAEGVLDYRATVARTLKEGDRVLEIGCCDGATTFLIAAHLQHLRTIGGGGRAERASWGEGSGGWGEGQAAARNQKIQVIGVDIGISVVDKARRVQAMRIAKREVLNYIAVLVQSTKAYAEGAAGVRERERARAR
jgi:hypothetical protein